jgi:hypothetical protein
LFVLQPETQDWLRQEADAARRAGFKDAKIVDLHGDRRHGGYHSAVVFPGAGEIQPLMYLNGLAEAIKKKGGQVGMLSAGLYGVFELSRILQHFVKNRTHSISMFQRKRLW